MNVLTVSAGGVTTEAALPTATASVLGLVKPDGTSILNTSGAISATAASVGAVPTARTISTTAPITGGGDLTANRTLAMAAAASGVSGYLTATDWGTFNGKYTPGTALSALTLDTVSSSYQFKVAWDFTGSVFGGGARAAFLLTDGTVKLYSQLADQAYLGTLSSHGLMLQTNGSNRLGISATGAATFASSIQSTTVKVTSAGGYISSDGSTGYTGSVTTASLVGKTLTIKDGIITGFA